MAQPTSASSPDALREAKRALRARVLAARDAMSAAARVDGSLAIGNTLAVRDDFLRAATVLLTLPLGSEWDTRPLLVAALEQGKRVALPRVAAAARSLDLCSVTDPERDLLPGYRGILEPMAHCAPVDPAAIDWALVPGVAFDQRGHRLGYGGGYYDRLLPMLRIDATRLAGAFELQVVANVPAALHDVKVQALATERRSLSFA